MCGIMIVAAVFFLLVVVVLGACLVLMKDSPREIKNGAWANSFPVLLIKVYLRACAKSHGALPKEWSVEEDGRVIIPGKVLKALMTTQKGWRVDVDMYANYCRLCGYGAAENPEPYCFLETQFIRHFFTIATSKQFPFSNLWMVYIQQEITVYTSVSAITSELCDLHCEVAGMRVTGKGVEVDMKCDVYSSKERKHLWSVAATLLSKHQKTRPTFNQTISATSPFSAEQENYSVQKVSVTANTGRRYAAVTGDYIFLHLYPWTARMVGYKLPIAHGMWTLARALAVIQEGSSTLASHPIQITASFKRPLFMPTEACVLYTDTNKEIMFEVRSAKLQHVLYLSGKISCL